MKILYLIAYTLAVINAGYINNDQAYNLNSFVQSGSYIQNAAKDGSEVYIGSVAPSVSYGSSGSFSAQISHGRTGYASNGYSPKGGEYIPVIKDGVPVDTPEVQKARAEHFALYAKAAAEAARASAAEGKYGGQQEYQTKYTQVYYPSSSGHGNARYNAGYSHQSNEYASPSPVSHSYVQSGAVDAPEIQQAKAVYFNTFVGAAGNSPHGTHYRRRRGLEYSQLSHDLYSSQPQHIPVITKEGVPVETPEVQAAKAQHLLAHAKAKSGHSEWKQGLESYGQDTTGWVNYEAPETNEIHYSITHENSHSWKPYHGLQHIPILDKNGVPIDTPEVQAAKYQHLLAHSQAKLKNQGLNEDWQQNPGIYGYAHQSSGSFGSSLSHQGIQITSNGVPEDTPEVKIAKARHFLAHAQEKAKHEQWADQSNYAYGTGSYQISNYHHHH